MLKAAIVPTTRFTVNCGINNIFRSSQQEPNMHEINMQNY